VDVAGLQDAVTRLERRYRERKGAYDELLRLRRQKSGELAGMREQLEVLEQVQMVFQVAAEKARQEARGYIEEMVTHALQAVFGPEIALEVRMQERAGRPEAEFYVASSYNGSPPVVNQPEDARGGGVVDVISLALRAALVEGSAAGMWGPLVFDEPGKHVSEEFSRPVAELLRNFAEDTGRQIIMVTHNAYLGEVGEYAYQVELKDGRSVVTRRSEPSRSAPAVQEALLPEL